MTSPPTQDAGQRPRLLLCEPTYFDIEYVINPWMDIDNKVDKERAWAQWRHLYETLEGLGAELLLLPPVEGLPDMVFTGDGGVVVGNRFVRSNFRPAERQDEAICFEQWFSSQGFDVTKLPAEVCFEGLGDVTLFGRNALCAYGQRTTAEAVPLIQAAFPELYWLATLELVDPRFFHLGVSATLLSEHVGLYVPDAFSSESRRTIERLPLEMLPLSDEDAEAFALNAIVIGTNLVTNYCSPGLREQLEERHFTVIVCDVSEFLKSGGGTRCLVLPFAP
jgi:N-dimethylarginine dimethylaminohydrolase